MANRNTAGNIKTRILLFGRWLDYTTKKTWNETLQKKQTSKIHLSTLIDRVSPSVWPRSASEQLLKLVLNGKHSERTETAQNMMWSLFGEIAEEIVCRRPSPCYQPRSNLFQNVGVDWGAEGHQPLPHTTGNKSMEVTADSPPPGAARTDSFLWVPKLLLLHPPTKKSKRLL